MFCPVAQGSVRSKGVKRWKTCSSWERIPAWGRAFFPSASCGTSRPGDATPFTSSRFRRGATPPETREATPASSMPMWHRSKGTSAPDR